MGLISDRRALAESQCDVNTERDPSIDPDAAQLHGFTEEMFLLPLLPLIVLLPFAVSFSLSLFLRCNVIMSRCVFCDGRRLESL